MALYIFMLQNRSKVEEIKSFYKMPPVEFLLKILILIKMCLVHCTQMSELETELLSKSGAVAGLCPVTEQIWVMVFSMDFNTMSEKGYTV